MSYYSTVSTTDHLQSMCRKLFVESRELTICGTTPASMDVLPGMQTYHLAYAYLPVSVHYVPKIVTGELRLQIDLVQTFSACPSWRHRRATSPPLRSALLLIGTR